jgi:GTP cyclohydrolase I
MKRGKQMMNFEAFIALLERIAPPELSEDWDHSGIQIYGGANDIERVLLCLDVTDTVISEAKALRVQLIISHHPFIFDGIYSLDATEPMGKKIQELIKSNISVYSAHMTYDKSNAGNTVQMARRIGLSGIPLPGKASGEEQDFSVLICRLDKAIPLNQLIEAVQTGLALVPSEVRLVHGSEEPITAIGLCAGSGGDYLEQIAAEKCQVFITGDVKYHLAMTAKELGITLIDPGHFGTEKFFAEDLAKRLSGAAGPEVTIFQTKNDRNPFTAR